MLALSLAADTLKRQGAARVMALLPYLAYARQDREEPGKGLGIAWVGEILRACGVDELVTIDIHSRRAAELLEMPVTSLSPAELFAAELERSGLLDATIVAPDEGAIERSRAVAEAAGIARPIVYLRKERTATGVVHRELVGEVGRRAVVVDDILDTGGTLVSCCRELRRRGVGETAVMVTHGLFTGSDGGSCFLSLLVSTSPTACPHRRPPSRAGRAAPLGAAADRAGACRRHTSQGRMRRPPRVLGADPDRGSSASCRGGSGPGRAWSLGQPALTSVPRMRGWSSMTGISTISSSPNPALRPRRRRPPLLNSQKTNSSPA